MQFHFKFRLNQGFCLAPLMLIALGCAAGDASTDDDGRGVAGSGGEGGNDDQSGSGGETTEPGGAGSGGDAGLAGEKGGGGVGAEGGGGAAPGGAAGAQSGGQAGSASGGTGGSSGTGGTGGSNSTGGTGGTQPAAPTHPYAEHLWSTSLTKEYLWQGFRPVLVESWENFWKVGPPPQSQPKDYVNGELHYRFVVTENPKHIEVWLETIFWQTMGGNHAIPRCTSTAQFKNPGTITCKLSPATINVDLGKKMYRIEMSAKYGTGGSRISDPPDIPKEEGLKMHITVVRVPKGQTFSGWQAYPLPADLEGKGFTRQ